MILKNLIYIYQLEQYDRKRFISFVYKNLNWFGYSKRGKLDWTLRAKLVCLIAMLLIATFVAIETYVSGSYVMGAVALFISLVLAPLFVVLADILIEPLVVFQKQRIVSEAREIILAQKKRGLATVGITGSFGKTSMKYLLQSAVGLEKKVFTFPGNINTEMGVANYIIKHQDELQKSDVLIAEMGAYHRGNIKALCNFVPPDYSVLLAIGEAHLERFGSQENIASAKYELPNAAAKKIFLNASNTNVIKFKESRLTNTVPGVEVDGKASVTDKQYLDDFAGISFVYQGQTFTTPIIADYITEFVPLVVGVAAELGVSIGTVAKAIATAQPAEHRLQVTKNDATNRVIIDDSYNGNEAGFNAGLDVLARAKGRKVVLTPGIVELGTQRSKEVHRTLANRYAKELDLTLLVKTEGTGFVIERFNEIGYNRFKLYKSAAEAHADLGNVLENGDTVLFQNDVTDNYS